MLLGASMPCASQLTASTMTDDAIYTHIFVNLVAFVASIMYVSSVGEHEHFTFWLQSAQAQQT